MHVTLVLTHECNLACSYCYTGEKFRREMDWETVTRSLDLLFSAPRELTPWRDEAPLDLGFFGGEPLICFEMLERAALEARDRAAREGRRLRLAVTTNGTLVTPARARRLKALDVQVTLSLDGCRAAHEATRPQRGGRSSFDDVIAGARNMVDAGLGLQIIAVVAPENVGWLGESVRFLAELGAREIILNPAFECAWSDADLVRWERGLEEAAEVYAGAIRAGRPIAMPTFDNKLLAAAKGGLTSCDSCGSGDREIAVSPRGNLFPCARMVGEDRDDALVIGHLDTGIDRGRVSGLKRGPADPACDECAEQWRCGASCACANLAETGTTHLPGGTQCWYEQATARVADAAGHRLLAEGDATFLSWTYGRVAAAAKAAGQEPSRIERRHRLPIAT
jgi:uncharacterized protein